MLPKANSSPVSTYFSQYVSLRCLIAPSSPYPLRRLKKAACVSQSPHSFSRRFPSPSTKFNLNSNGQGSIMSRSLSNIDAWRACFSKEALASSISLISLRRLFRLTSVGRMTARLSPLSAASISEDTFAGQTSLDRFSRSETWPTTLIDSSWTRQLSMRRSFFGREYLKSTTLHRLKDWSSRSCLNRIGNNRFHLPLESRPAQQTVS